MKIAHVVPALTKGGGEKVAAELANHASRAGHKITMIVGWPVDPSLLRDKLLTDVKVVCVSKKLRSRIGRYFVLILWFWKNRELLGRQDIIHCHLSYGLMFGFLVSLWRTISRTRGPAILQTNHSVGAPVSNLRLWLQSFLTKKSDALALIAEDDYWSSFEKKHPKILTKVICNGISTPNKVTTSESKKDLYRQQFGIPDHCKLVVGAVGRMTADREPWIYLPVFKKIAKEFGPGVHFLLAGGGPELDRMRSLAIEHNLEEQVHFPGEVKEPIKALAVMDLYISINVGSITGLAGMEAAMFGVPVIAMQWKRGYIATPNDWIWSSTNQSDVAQCSCDLLASKKSRDVMAHQQKSYVQLHHTIDAMANSYYDLYKAMLLGRKNSTIDAT